MNDLPDADDQDESPIVMGGHHLGDCKKCGEKAQLTDAGLCDDCCEGDDCESLTEDK